MSFNNCVNRARNPLYPMDRRLGSLKNCIRLFSYLTKSSYQRNCARCDELTGIFSNRPTNESSLIVILDLLVRSRNRYLEKLFAVGRKRIRQKIRGKRHFNKADQKVLKEAQILASALK